jgi:hypothetical protein
MTSDVAKRGKKAKEQEEEPKRRGRPPLVRNLYASALSSAEAITIKYASDVEGLDDEVDLLRTKLHTLLSEQKEGGQIDMKLFIRGMELLRKLVATRYRLSKKAQEDLASAIAGLLQGVGEQFYPEGRDGA